MTDAPQGPQPKPGILDIAPYVGGKSSIAGVAEPMKLSSNENALGAGEKARDAYQAAADAGGLQSSAELKLKMDDLALPAVTAGEAPDA